MCVQEQWRPSLAKPGLDDTLSFTSLLSIPRDIARGVFERRALDLYDQANDVDREHDAEQDALFVDHVQAVHVVTVQLGHHVREPLRREDGPRRLTGVGMRCVLRVRASLVMMRTRPLVRFLLAWMLMDGRVRESRRRNERPMKAVIMKAACRLPTTAVLFGRADELAHRTNEREELVVLLLVGRVVVAAGRDDPEDAAGRVLVASRS